MSYVFTLHWRMHGAAIGAFLVLCVVCGCLNLGLIRPVPIRVTGNPSREVVVELLDGSGLKFELCYIPPGRFLMGSNKGYPYPILSDDEKPVHEVIITRGFFMGKYETTELQFAKVMGLDAEKARPDMPVSSSSPRIDTDCTWYDAVEFCRRLSLATGLNFRLPTEAEWEYACRAGSDMAFCFGSDFGRLTEYTNMEPTGFGGWLQKEIAPVGRKKPNAWGLHDMHGNVAEWCSDWYAEDYYSRSPKEDPTGPENGKYKVIRGGSSSPYEARCAMRQFVEPDRRDASNNGFRIVCDSVEEICRLCEEAAAGPGR